MHTIGPESCRKGRVTGDQKQEPPDAAGVRQSAAQRLAVRRTVVAKDHGRANARQAWQAFDDHHRVTGSLIREQCHVEWRAPAAPPA